MSAKKSKEKKKVGFPGICLRILGGLLAALLLLLLVMFAIPLTETGDQTAVEGSADWMAKLDDDLSLDAIVIPGTHDSATRYVQLGFFSKCQAKSIGAQLEAGYRYLDIRLAVDGERMKLMHGFTNCRSGPVPWNASLTLDEVLEECYVFLAEHPGETVIFAVKQEHGSESVEEFETLLDRYVRAEPEFWLLTDSIPCLGEARGKLVLMRRYEDEAGLGAAAGIPLLWQNQNGYQDPSLNTVSEDNGSYTLWVQDRYEYDTEEKWAAFTAGLARAEAGEGNVAIHFLSTKGHAKFGHPYGFMKPLNERLAQQQKLTGWIVVDFGSAPLAETIYLHNFD
jgi:1-phosphatidylinositol phosphodiesterase